MHSIILTGSWLLRIELDTGSWSLIAALRMNFRLLISERGLIYLIQDPQSKIQNHK